MQIEAEIAQPTQCKLQTPRTSLSSHRWHLPATTDVGLPRQLRIICQCLKDRFSALDSFLETDRSSPCTRPLLFVQSPSSPSTRSFCGTVSVHFNDRKLFLEPLRRR